MAKNPPHYDHEIEYRREMPGGRGIVYCVTCDEIIGKDDTGEYKK